MFSSFSHLILNAALANLQTAITTVSAKRPLCSDEHIYLLVVPSEPHAKPSLVPSHDPSPSRVLSFLSTEASVSAAIFRSLANWKKRKKKACQNLSELHAAWHSLVFVSTSKHKQGVWRRAEASSVSPRGLSSLMLIVIFLSRHCSLLCSPSFLIILSAIYQTMNLKGTKKFELVVSLHYGLCRVF